MSVETKNVEKCPKQPYMVITLGMISGNENE